MCLVVLKLVFSVCFWFAVFPFRMTSDEKIVYSPKLYFLRKLLVISVLLVVSFKINHDKGVNNGSSQFSVFTANIGIVSRGSWIIYELVEFLTFTKKDQLISESLNKLILCCVGCFKKYEFSSDATILFRKTCLSLASLVIFTFWLLFYYQNVNQHWILTVNLGITLLHLMYFSLSSLLLVTIFSVFQLLLRCFKVEDFILQNRHFSVGKFFEVQQVFYTFLVSLQSTLVIAIFVVFVSQTTTIYIMVTFQLQRSSHFLGMSESAMYCHTAASVLVLVFLLVCSRIDGVVNQVSDSRLQFMCAPNQLWLSLMLSVSL